MELFRLIIDNLLIKTSYLKEKRIILIDFERFFTFFIDCW